MDVSLLKTIPLFADVPDEKLGKIAPFTTTTSSPKARTSSRRGATRTTSTRSRRARPRSSATGEHLADLGPGDVFGEQGLLEKQERSATVTATSRLRVIKIEHWEISRMRKAMPEVVEELQRRGRGAPGLSSVPARPWTAGRVAARHTAGGQGKSGAKPARSRHCDRVRVSPHDSAAEPLGADASPGRRGAESRKPGDLSAGQPM